MIFGRPEETMLRPLGTRHQRDRRESSLAQQDAAAHSDIHLLHAPLEIPLYWGLGSPLRSI